jgi:hypothetical protein
MWSSDEDSDWLSLLGDALGLELYRIGFMMHVLSFGGRKIKKPPKASGGHISAGDFASELAFRASGIKFAQSTVLLQKPVAGIPYWNPLLMQAPIIHIFV